MSIAAVTRRPSRDLDTFPVTAETSVGNANWLSRPTNIIVYLAIGTEQNMACTRKYSNKKLAYSNEEAMRLQLRNKIIN
jgi:hypothetical protein